MDVKPSYSKDVLPWFLGQFLGRKQQSDLRVAEPCIEMWYALENRLITVYKCDLLCRNEVLIQYTARGKKQLDQDISVRFAFPIEPGCDDDSLQFYLAQATPLAHDELSDLLVKTPTLDEYLEHFSLFDDY